MSLENNISAKLIDTIIREESDGYAIIELGDSICKCKLSELLDEDIDSLLFILGLSNVELHGGIADGSMPINCKAMAMVLRGLKERLTKYEENENTRRGL